MQIRDKKNNTGSAYKKGFTLIELMIAVAIIGILVTIGLPRYVGYVDNSKTSVVKNNLRAIYMQQQEYLQKNNVYYFSDIACTNNNTLINNNLFSGQATLTSNEGFYYCITQSATNNFTATAKEVSGSRSFSIDNLNITTNF